MEKRLKYTVFFLSTLLLSILQNITFAQDGEAIFKAKCSACHILGKDGTGPNLQGVKAKWEGEEDFLYEWVLNSPKVIGEGKSARAQAVKDYSPTAMPVQDVTLDEAKAIIDFVDAWTPPAPVVKEGDPAGETVVASADYEKNLTIFNVLIFILFLLLISILAVSKTTAGLIKSDLFREKIIAGKNKKSDNPIMRSLLLVLFSAGAVNSASALSFDAPAVAEKTNLWLYVENSDIYVLLAIVLLLLGFLLHQVNMFNKVLRIMKPLSEKQKKAKEEGADITRILTGAVPIEEEHKIDLGHDYDGIRELDNPMPPWWLAGFFISIVFAVVYMFHYHVLGTGDLQTAEYEKSMIEGDKEVQAYLDKMAMNVDETNATLMEDEGDLMKGKELFINNCAVCHTDNGRGATGPNLTDNYWIYGGDIKDVYKVIRKGAPNGMPEHQSKFNPIQIQQVASYVLHFEEIPQSKGGKEPQGELYSAEELTEENTANEEETIVDVTSVTDETIE